VVIFPGDPGSLVYSLLGLYGKFFVIHGFSFYFSYNTNIQNQTPHRQYGLEKEARVFYKGVFSLTRAAGLCPCVMAGQRKAAARPGPYSPENSGE
jgi:hypothetical protein